MFVCSCLIYFNDIFKKFNNIKIKFILVTTEIKTNIFYCDKILTYVRSTNQLIISLLN